MRVVLDTNVLARAARGGAGPAAELLRLVTTPLHLLILSPPLLAELLRVLCYARMRQVHGLDDVGIQAYLQSIQAGAIVVAPVSPPPVQTSDPADDLVIATAIAGQADVLCTLDRHLLTPPVQAGCTPYGVRVLRDVDLLHELRSRSSPPQGTP